MRRAVVVGVGVVGLFGCGADANRDVSTSRHGLLTVSPEIELEGPVGVIDDDQQRSPAAAFDGTTHIVVFVENNESGQVVRAARVGAAGAPLDIGGTIVYASGGGIANPVIAYGEAGTFLVVWQHIAPSGQVLAARVTSAGEVLDVPPLLIGGTESADTAPAVGWNGSRFLASWQAPGGLRVEGRAIGSDGSMSPSFAVAANASEPSVAGDGAGAWLVAWTDWRAFPPAIYGSRILDDLSLVSPGGVRISDTLGAGEPDVAGSPGGYFVAWAADGASPRDIRGTRVSHAGAVLDSPSVLISGAMADQSAPAVIWDGTTWVITWQDLRSGPLGDVYLARVTAAGVALDGGGVSIEGSAAGELQPDIGVGSPGSLLVWTGPGPGLFSVVRAARIVDGAATGGPDPIVVAPNATTQTDAAVAWNGSLFLVVWEDSRAGVETDVYGVRVSASGIVLDDPALAIGVAPGSQGNPALISDGDRFLVAWDDQRGGEGSDIYGAFVGTDGSVASGFPIAASVYEQAEPAVAWNGSVYLVAWHDDRLSPGTSSIFFKRLDSAGTILPPVLGTPLTVGPWDSFLPEVAANGSDFLVTWYDDDPSSIRARRVTGAGVPLDPTGLAIGGFSVSGFRASVASDGQDWVVAWSESLGIRTLRVDRDGLLSGSSSTGGGTKVDPGLAFAGTGYAVAWRTDLALGPTGTDLLGSRVSLGADMVDPAGEVLAASARYEQRPALAGSASGEFLLVYHRDVPETPYETYRVFARRLQWTGASPGTTCGSADECIDGLCVDGVCCTVSCGGGSASDCAACSTSAGGTANGTCLPLGGGTVCRPAVAECDLEEACDGVDHSCPADRVKDDGTTCAAGGCVGGMCLPIPDAGPDASSEPDGPPPPDASWLTDAAPVPDATADSSPAPDDAAVVDAAMIDMGAAEAAVDVGGGGCACRVEPTATSSLRWLPLAMLLLVSLRRRGP